MPYRKKTLRTMSPTTRKVAKLIGELESVSRRLKNLIVDIQLLESDSRALKFATTTRVPGLNAPAAESTDHLEW